MTFYILLRYYLSWNSGDLSSESVSHSFRNYFRIDNFEIIAVRTDLVIIGRAPITEVYLSYKVRIFHLFEESEESLLFEVSQQVRVLDYD